MQYQLRAGVLPAAFLSLGLATGCTTMGGEEPIPPPHAAGGSLDTSGEGPAYYADKSAQALGYVADAAAGVAWETLKCALGPCLADMFR